MDMVAKGTEVQRFTILKYEQMRQVHGEKNTPNWEVSQAVSLVAVVTTKSEKSARAIVVRKFLMWD